MSTVELWLPVAGYEGAYEVSSLGRVRSVGRLDSRGHQIAGKVLSPRKTTRNHLAVALYMGGVRRDFQVHTLVLEAFVGPRPDGTEGCHWNDDPTDNGVENLRWDTRSANVLDSVRNGTHRMASKTHCPKGHPYTTANTYHYPAGNRACNECRRQYREAHHEERLAKGREYARERRARTNRKAA